MIVVRQTRCPTDNFFAFLGKCTCPSVGSPFPDSGWKRSCLFHHRFMITMCYAFMLYLLCVLCRSAIVYPLLFAKFGRFTPNRLALIGQKYALIGHFYFCRLALIGHGHFRKSLIMNKSSWKYGSFPKICKQLVISLTSFFRLHIFDFPSCRFQNKSINEIAGHNPHFFSFRSHSPTTNRIIVRAAPKYT